MAARIPATDIVMTPQLEEAIAGWYEAANKLKTADAIESAMRLALVDLLIAQDSKKRREGGKDRFAMPGGWQLDIEHRINVKIDESLLQAVQDEIKALPVTEDGEIVSIDKAVVFKPSLSESNFNLLPDEAKVILNKCLTWTPGKPGVKLELPKSVQAKVKPKVEETS